MLWNKHICGSQVESASEPLGGLVKTKWWSSPPFVAWWPGVAPELAFPHTSKCCWHCWSMEHTFKAVTLCSPFGVLPDPASALFVVRGVAPAPFISGYCLAPWFVSGSHRCLHSFSSPLSSNIDLRRPTIWELLFPYVTQGPGKTLFWSHYIFHESLIGVVIWSYPSFTVETHAAEESLRVFALVGGFVLFSKGRPF